MDESFVHDEKTFVQEILNHVVERHEIVELRRLGRHYEANGNRRQILPPPTVTFQTEGDAKCCLSCDFFLKSYVVTLFISSAQQHENYLKRKKNCKQKKTDFNEKTESHQNFEKIRYQTIS